MEGDGKGKTNPVANLTKAVKAVQKGSKLSHAAFKYNIPVSILFNRITAIRHMKELNSQPNPKDMNSQPGTSNTNLTQAEAEEECPDEYGMVVDEKKFRSRSCQVKSAVIYVTEEIQKALRLVLRGATIQSASQQFNVNRQSVAKKLRQIKALRSTKLSKKEKIQPTSKSTSNQLSIREPFPVLSRNNPLYRIINRLTKTSSVVFPPFLQNSISDLENGESYENVLEKYSLNLFPLVKIIRKLRFAEKSSSETFPQVISDLHYYLPRLLKSSQLNPNSFPPSPNNEQMEKMMKAVREVSKGKSVTEVARIYKVPYSSLYGRASSLGLLKSVYRKRKKTHVSRPMIKVELEAAATMKESPKKVKPLAKASALVCLFCHQPGNREVELGKLHVINKVVVHYYCLLFSSALEQNGEDHEGILGFLPKDILKELSRGAKLKCNFCSKKGATIGCNNKYCKKTYHFPCGLDNFAQFTFTDNFSSMCVKHRKFQNGCNKGEEVECPICMEVMVADPKWAVWSPCCQKSSWFHKICLQKLALSAGYFFKCPLCNDKNIFVPEMLRQGIFVPEQDASWELEPNAFQDLLERPIRCEAPKCKCPAGRKSDEEGTRWEVVLCHLCGSTGTHLSCGRLKQNCVEWHCPTCTEMLQESALRSKQENRGRRVQGRSKRKREEGDEEEDEDEEEVEVEGGEGGSELKRRRLSSDASLVRESSQLPFDEDEVFVPKGIRGDVVIRSMEEGGLPLSDALKEMRNYARALPSKLVKSKFDEDSFLAALNKFAEADPTAYLLTKAHLRRFVECSFNYDQMRLMRKVLEQGFILNFLKVKSSVRNRGLRENPFSGKKSRVKYSHVKKTKALQKSIANLLVKAKEVELLEGNRTWSLYNSMPGSEGVQTQKAGEDGPSTSSQACSEKSPKSVSNCARYVRMVESTTLKELCGWCNRQLIPGMHPTTILLSIGRLEVICTSCSTCNAFSDLFPQMPWLQPMPERLPEEGSQTPQKGGNAVAMEDSKDNIIKAESSKGQQSSIYDYFGPNISSKWKCQPVAQTPTKTEPFSPKAGSSGKRARSSGKKSPRVQQQLTPKEEKIVKRKPTVSSSKKRFLSFEDSSCSDEKKNCVYMSSIICKPPLHAPLPIAGSATETLCKSCNLVEDSQSTMKKSCIYCPCCKDAPFFCSLDHFQLWHSFTHNWMTIPPTQGNQRPQKLCKVCPESNLTRFYCPACPWNLGYCSLGHYDQVHSSEAFSGKKSDKTSDSVKGKGEDWVKKEKKEEEEEEEEDSNGSNGKTGIDPNGNTGVKGHAAAPAVVQNGSTKTVSLPTHSSVSVDEENGEVSFPRFSKLSRRNRKLNVVINELKDKKLLTDKLKAKEKSSENTDSLSASDTTVKDSPEDDLNESVRTTRDIPKANEEKLASPISNGSGVDADTNVKKPDLNSLGEGGERKENLKVPSLQINNLEMGVSATC